MRSQHTKCSVLYRAERIDEHTVQIRASLVVMMYLVGRYSEERFKRHRERIKRALLNIEVRCHEDNL